MITMGHETATAAVVKEPRRHDVPLSLLIRKKFPRLCLGGSTCLTFPAVDGIRDVPSLHHRDGCRLVPGVVANVKTGANASSLFLRRGKAPLRGQRR